MKDFIVDGICYGKDMDIIYVDSSLQEINIQEGTKRIKEDTFSCYNCKILRIPSTLTSIDEEAFSGLDNLEAIIVDENNPIFSSQNGILYNKNKTELLFCPYFNQNKVLEIPSSVKTIGDFAFSCNETIEEIIMTDVVNVSDHAFSNCSILQKVDLGNKVEIIGEEAFLDCCELRKVTFSNYLADVESSAFSGCTVLESVTFPDTVERLGPSVFSGCKKLLSVNIPKALTRIPPYLFFGCENLNNVNVHSGISSIGAYAFAYCYMLTNLKLNNGLSSIEQNAFFNCVEMDSIIIPSSVSVLGDFIFSACFKLKAIFVSNDAIEKNPNFYEQNKEKISNMKTLDMLLDEGYNFKEANEILKQINTILEK